MFGHGSVDFNFDFEKRANESLTDWLAGFNGGLRMLSL
jgi:hypothetical protein